MLWAHDNLVVIDSSVNKSLKHNCKDVYAKFQLTSEEALINVSISSPKFCFLLSSDHSCYCNRSLINAQHLTSEYCAGLIYRRCSISYKGV